jgi:hypothetical protein
MTSVMQYLQLRLPRQKGRLLLQIVLVEYRKHTGSRGQRLGRLRVFL